jgi:hypothetical protein
MRKNCQAIVQLFQTQWRFYFWHNLTLLLNELRALGECHVIADESAPVSELLGSWKCYTWDIILTQSS